MTTLAPTFKKIETELNGQFVERRDAIEALLLTVLTRQHAFILGPPGTGKSLLVRSFVERITGARYFEQVLSKNRPDAAVLGPYDMDLLREKSAFVRKDEGFLTTCEFTFLDEVGKTSPTLGHDLLAALNERVKHEVSNGRSAHPIPLHSAFTASNELLADDSEDQAALWDRLLVRTVVDYIQSGGNFKRLLTKGADAPAKPTTVDLAALEFACDEVAEVTLTDAVLDLVYTLRKTLIEDGMHISDRRWRESMKVVQAAAWLRGDTVTSPEDLHALRFTLWETTDDLRRVQRAILTVANPDSEEVAKLADMLDGLRSEMNSRKGQADAKVIEFVMELKAKVDVVIDQANGLKAKVTSPRALAEIEGLIASAEALVEEAVDNSPLSFARKPKDRP